MTNKLWKIFVFAMIFALQGPAASAIADIFQSALTEENFDYENTGEFPKNPDRNPGLGTPSRENLIGALHIRLPLPPHGAWSTDETDQTIRYLRVAFKKPLSIGTIIGGAGEISYLKPRVPFPGSFTDDSQWVVVPVPKGQAGLRVVPFPPHVITRAIRLKFSDNFQNGIKSRSNIGGMLILKDRLHNLIPEALVFASSQRTGTPAVTEENKVQDLVSWSDNSAQDDSKSYSSGGRKYSSWSVAPVQDISREHPEWVIFVWPQEKTFCGIGFLNAFARHMIIDTLSREEKGNPVTAPETSWSSPGEIECPVWWRPAYTDTYLCFKIPVATRAIRVRITQPLTNENSDVAYLTGNSRRVAKIDGVMAFTDLGNRPVPPRPKPVVELPPVKIKYQMPENGKLTMVINDINGRRVRNLVTEVDRAQGKGIESWDARDDSDRMVPPGKYFWKAITYQPLHLYYQMTVNCSGNPPWWKSGTWGDQLGQGSWLSDHCPPNDVTAIGDRVFIGAFLAESGHTILACDLDGKKLWGTKWMETAGAAYLTNDGKKVYTAGDGGWIGDRLMIFEFDPQTFQRRKVAQLDYDSGMDASGFTVSFVSGIAAYNGKLYVSFNRPRKSWTSSGVTTQNVDMEHTSQENFDRLIGLLRIKGEVPSHGLWQGQESGEATQYMRLAFKNQQPVGTLIALQDLTVSALKADASFPGDVSKEDQWLLFPAVQAGRLKIITAPPALTTRALRFTFRNNAATDKPWKPNISGALILSHRLTNVLPGATYIVSSGEVKGDGNWSTTRERPITPDDPATMLVIWPDHRTFRALGFLNCFAKRLGVDVYTGQPEQDPATASETAWVNLGEITPAVRWRPVYNDDYFDAGKNVSTRAIRLRVLEPLIAENPDISGLTGNKPFCAGIGGLVVLQDAGDEPAVSEVPAQRISVVNIADGQWEKHIPVSAPRFPHFDLHGNLFVVSGKELGQVSLEDGKFTPVLQDKIKDPRGIAFDAAGNLYVADGGPEQIKVFSPDSRLIRLFGTAGGRILGSYDQNRIENPHGIAVDRRGNLWITESDFQPKRTSCWSGDGRFLKEFIGPAQYGGGGFLDPKDKSRFYYNGVEYAIDWKTGDWKIKNILCRDQKAFSGGKADHPVYLNDKQYMVNDPGSEGGTSGRLLLVGEFRDDRIIPLSVMGNAELWKPFREDSALRRIVRDKALNLHSFVWTDENGDGLPQPDEVVLSGTGIRLNTTYWPSYVNRKLSVVMDNRIIVPVGFTNCGAPVYRPFDGSVLPSFPSENIYATALDSQGRVLVNGRPVLAMKKDGKVDWTYPQKWVGVHDSQIAPLPKQGQLIGGLGFTGQEEIAGIGETFMLSGNKGEWYLFTSDGLLAATVWHDYRERGVNTWNFPKVVRGMSLDNVSLGEEHFGGEFVKTSDGKYYMVAGHNHNSIIELKSLDTMKRQEGSFTLTGNDIKTAEQWVVRQAASEAQKETPKFAVFSVPKGQVKADGDLSEWDENRFITIGNRGSFGAACDAKNLYLAYKVDSNSFLRNNGDDRNMLFKTGDSVDFQIGTDSKADPARLAPVPGDQRLLVSMFNGNPIGVLYRHRVPDTRNSERIGFASPWRVEYVDKIIFMDQANIGIAKTAKGYAVEVTVPLDLLEFKPESSRTYKVDFGILSADSSGSATQVRTYWSNQATGIVSDVPSEIMLFPGLWGTCKFE